MMYGLETICQKTTFLWRNLPIGVKLATYSSDFKTKLEM